MEETTKKSHRDMAPEDIGKMLDVVSDKIPQLLKAVKDLIYSPEAGKEMGQAVGNFYKELVSNGLDTELASNLTRDYMSTLQNVGRGISVHSEK